MSSHQLFCRFMNHVPKKRANHINLQTVGAVFIRRSPEDNINMNIYGKKVPVTISLTKPQIISLISASFVLFLS